MAFETMGHGPRQQYNYLSIWLEKKFTTAEAEQVEKDEKLKQCWESPKVMDVGILKFLILFGANATHTDPIKKLPPIDSDCMKKKWGEDQEKPPEYAEFDQFLETAKRAWNKEHPDQPMIPLDSTKLRNEKLFALSLDGGGIRGLVSSFTLRFVSNRLFGDGKIKNRFHWIAGTSTGAIIALALIKNDELEPLGCMKLYWTLKDKIFLQEEEEESSDNEENSVQDATNVEVSTENEGEAGGYWVLKPLKAVSNVIRSAVSGVNTTASAMKTVATVTVAGVKFYLKNPPQKQTENLEKALKEVFKSDTLGSRGAIWDEAYHRPRVAAVARRVAPQPEELHVFRNYPNRSSDGSDVNLKLWQVGRASGAAPIPYFLPCHIDDISSFFLDGGLGANDPSRVLEEEMVDYITSSHNNGKTAAEIQAILSIGTGKARPSPITNFQKVSATDSKWRKRNVMVNNAKHSFFSLINSATSVPDHGDYSRAVIGANNEPHIYKYYRLCPEIDEVELNATDPAKLIKMLWQTLAYLTEQQNLERIDMFAKHYAKECYINQEINQENVESPEKKKFRFCTMM